MHQRVLMRLREFGGRRSLLSPLVVGLGLWIGFPTATALQDMASFVSGVEAAGPRWNTFVERAVAGSVHSAEMPFVDATVKSGTISGAGISAPGIGEVAFRGKRHVLEPTPDEDRVNRNGKRDRLLRVAPVAPPKSFSAGSVFERTSHLLKRAPAATQMVFAEPAIKGHEVQIASAFHVPHKAMPAAGVPPMLAGLINNEKGDVLATAYAAPTPDYAKASPFASLLREEDPFHGRFVPPVAEGDHAWMGKPLPAHVFSAKEQKCLAEGVYFEARGENLKGQAAVAQVILNRVRNPHYPNTICGVVYQNDDWRNRCQFSFACDGIKDRISSPRHWKTAQDIAMAVTAGKIFIPEVGSSTHYHATYVKPGWSRAMEKMKKIGLHVFYRTHDGGWD